MGITFVLRHMENLMEEVLVVLLMDVLLASLSLKQICKRILTEGNLPSKLSHGLYVTSCFE